MELLKKIFKVVCKIIIRLLSIIIALLALIFIYHIVANIIEENNLEAPGDLIEVYEDEFMHVKLLGEGDYTFVMLSGMGTPSPYYDYYSLAQELSKNNRVLLVEQLGYGYSSMTKQERTLENYTNEIDKVLEYYAINKNVILLAHSYSGVISLSYANSHEDLVKGLVCLDCTSAYQVAKHKDETPPKYSTLISLIPKTGIYRAIGLVYPKLLEELLIDVPEDLIGTYKHFIYNRPFNKVIVNEMNNFPYIELEMLDKQYRNNLYVTTILATETITTMKEEYKDGDMLYDWETMHNKLISNKDIQKINILEGSHYIHHHNISKVTKLINEMLDAIR